MANAANLYFARRVFRATLTGGLIVCAVGWPRSIAAQPQDPRCAALAALARFTIISTKDTNRRDLYLGADATVGTTDVPGAAPAGPLGRSIGGLCGNDMLITAGSRMGLLATRGDVDFGALTKCRILRIESEFANTPSGKVKMAKEAPFLGPVTRSNDGSAACTPQSKCDGGCVTGRRLVVGADLFSSSDGQTRRGLAGTGSSLNFKLCDAALSLLESTGSGRQFGPSSFQSEIENYQPLPSQQVVLGAGNCRACPLVTTADSGCAPCATDDIIRTRARTKKIVITLGTGLQVLDLPRVALQGKTILELRGQGDTVALIRVAEGLRLGGEAQVILGPNGIGKGTLEVDKVLWVANGHHGGRPNLSRSSTFRGTVLATGRAGIRLGGLALVEGALWSRKVSVGRQSTVQHFPFSELFPLPGSGQTFALAGIELNACVDSVLLTTTATPPPPSPSPSPTATATIAVARANTGIASTSDDSNPSNNQSTDTTFIHLIC